MRSSLNKYYENSLSVDWLDVSAMIYYYLTLPLVVWLFKYYLSVWGGS